MQNIKKANIDLRGLMFQPIALNTYKVLAIEVEKELDAKGRKFAIAVVITKNSKKQWDKETMHIIELKHCYNRLSTGPNHTRYEDLPGLVLEIFQISPGAKITDLDVVTWTLHNKLD